MVEDAQSLKIIDIANERNDFKVEDISVVTVSDRELMVVTKGSLNMDLSHQIELHNYTYSHNSKALKILSLIP